MILPVRRVRLRHTFLTLCLAIAGPVLSAPSAGAPSVTDSSHARIDELIREASALDANEPARAIAVAQEALALAERSPDRLDELRARTQLSESLRRNSRYDEAEQVLLAGLAVPLGESPAEQIARAQLVYEHGQLRWNRGDYVGAEAYYLEAQHAAEQHDVPLLLIRALNSRGIVARHQKLWEPSEQHFRTALALAEEHQAADQRLQIRNNLAILLYDCGRFDEARPLLLENLRTHTAAGNRRSMANALINLGALESTAGNHAAAVPFYRQALALRLELGVPRHIASARISLASALARSGQGDEALALLHAAAPAAEKVGSQEIMGNLHSALAETHAARGDFRAALESQRQAEAAKQAVASEKTAATVAELRERFEAEKRSRQIAELHAAREKQDAQLAAREAELRRTRIERIGLAGLLVFGLTAAVAIISRQRAVTRAERRILEETRRARDAAEEAAALQARLLDLASHDLKTPLVGTMMTAETIAEESADRPEIAARAHALREESRRMLGLVQDLLDGSATESHRLQLAREPVDLATLAADTVAVFADRAARKNQRLELIPGDASGATRIEGDPARLRQVLENLVSNALKFSPPGTTTRLQLSRPDAATVRLAVRDEGPGLTPEDRAGLFQRFRRLSAVPTGGEPSTGLGLALARDLVIAHGGRLEVDSTPGQGATFSIEFPVRS